MWGATMAWEAGESCWERLRDLQIESLQTGDLLGIVVQPLDLHLVNMGSTGPTHGEGRLQPHPGDVLKPTPNVRKSPRSGLNLEGRLSDPQTLFCLSKLSVCG